jgi:hypothetical protein
MKKTLLIMLLAVAFLGQAAETNIVNIVIFPATHRAFVNYTISAPENPQIDGKHVHVKLTNEVDFAALTNAVVPIVKNAITK